MMTTTVKITVNGQEYHVPDFMPISLIHPLCDAVPSKDYELSREEICTDPDGRRFDTFIKVKHLNEIVQDGQKYEFKYTGTCHTA